MSTTALPVAEALDGTALTERDRPRAGGAGPLGDSGGVAVARGAAEEVDGVMAALARLVVVVLPVDAAGVHGARVGLATRG